MIDLDIRDAIARVTLDRAPVNAINDEWLRLFDERLDRIEAAEGLSVVHIRSAHKAFCGGMDLDHIRKLFVAGGSDDDFVQCVARFQHVFARIEGLPQVTVCEIGGAALGGGLELALACDIRVASERAKLGLPETGLGLIPGAGGTQRLTRLCGKGTASRIILGADVIDGATAAQLGIVQWAWPPEELASQVEALIGRLVKLSPRAVHEAKALIAAAGDDGRDGFAEEIAADRRLYNTEDTRRRVSDFLAGAR